MSVLRFLVPLPLVCTAALAQPPATSPRGFLNQEGQTSLNQFVRERRFQQIDATGIGSPLRIGTIAFRRDGGPIGGGSSASARTFELQVVMGHADMAVLQRDFDSNFLPGQRLVAYTSKPTSFPDWTGAAGSPAPFDFRVPLDVPFSYNGADALVIDFQHAENTFLGSFTTADAAGSILSTPIASGTPLGTGCPVTGATLPWKLDFELHNGGPGQSRLGMRLRVEAAQGPVAAPALLHVDFVDRALSVPGLCSTVHAFPLVAVPVFTGPRGEIPGTTFAFPYLPSAEGLPLVAQLAALDPVQPTPTVLVSNGSRAVMPRAAKGTGLEVAYHWSSLPVRTSGISDLVWNAGLVIELAP